ncbi:MAG: hypothetical protein IAF02_23730 [Anaerolineae bacterium]|nr:hypothetical protein [Anaerolineae bacterium]
MTTIKNITAGIILLFVLIGLATDSLPRAKGAEGDYYLYLPVVMKSPPTLTIAPVALACGSNDWTVSWSGGDDSVVEYVLEEAQDAAFTSPAVYTSTQPSLAFSHAPSVNNLYYYRVRADGSWGAGPWSATRSVVGGFADNFANAGSGWAVTDTTTGSLGYQGGQYLVGVKQAGYLISAKAPDAARNGYEAAVEARWANGSATNGIYGLMFGAANSLQQYYFLAVRADEQLFRLYFYDGSLPTADRLRGINSWTSSGVIKTGFTMNKLYVKRIGSSIQVSINGSNLGTWSDGALTGATYTGVMAASNPANPAITAQFDNFSVGACATLSARPLLAVEQPVTVPLPASEFSAGQVELDW